MSDHRHVQEAPHGGTDTETVRDLPQALRVFFSRKGPRRLALNAAASWGVRLMMGPLIAPGEWVALAGVGLGWPLQEWAAHKYLLHLPPKPGRRDPEFARRHREHHVVPRDLDLCLLPMGVIRQALPANIGLWLVLAGPTRTAATGIAAYSTMALVYEWTHFLVHTGYKPRGRLFKRIRKNHRLHHYRNEHYWLGFTLPQVDQLLGTEPDPRDVPHSETVRDLFGLVASQTEAPPQPDGVRG